MPGNLRHVHRLPRSRGSFCCPGRLRFLVVNCVLLRADYSPRSTRSRHGFPCSSTRFASRGCIRATCPSRTTARAITPARLTPPPRSCRWLSEQRAEGAPSLPLPLSAEDDSMPGSRWVDTATARSGVATRDPAVRGVRHPMRPASSAVDGYKVSDARRGILAARGAAEGSSAITSPGSPTI